MFVRDLPQQWLRFYAFFCLEGQDGTFDAIKFFTESSTGCISEIFVS